MIFLLKKRRKAMLFLGVVGTLSIFLWQNFTSFSSTSDSLSGANSSSISALGNRKKMLASINVGHRFAGDDVDGPLYTANDLTPISELEADVAEDNLSELESSLGEPKVTAVESLKPKTQAPIISKIVACQPHRWESGIIEKNRFSKGPHIHSSQQSYFGG